MKKLISLTAVVLLAGAAAQAQTTILADTYDITDSGTGFVLGTGVNAGINPPATRLTGTWADNLRYLYTVTGTSVKGTDKFSISGNKLQVVASANSGRFSLSADGSTPFNFAPALGTGAASASSPSVYDLRISMANTLSGSQRFSFALGTVESSAGDWDFGLQLYRAAVADSFYTIGKRIDTLSSGLTSDQNAAIATTAAGTYGTELDFLIRVTDAGAESAGYNSRVQVFLGNSSIYDTATDSTLVNGFRFDGADRFLSWDQAGAGSTITGAVTYDNFSVTLIPEPSSLALAALGAFGLLLRRRK